MRAGLILLVLLLAFGVLMWRFWTVAIEAKDTGGWTTLHGHRVERHRSPFQFYYTLVVLALLVPAFLFGIYAMARQVWLAP